VKIGDIKAQRKQRQHSAVARLALSYDCIEFAR
jgi:hypothetical protein